MRPHRTLIRSTVALAMLVPLALTASVAADTTVSITTAKAPIVPNGTTTGADPDFVVTFADRHPDVPGIDVLAGGTLSLTLPQDFVQDDPAAALTGAILQGWPQSPRLPFPALTYDPATHTIIATTPIDLLYQSSENPGPKQMHLILPGFTNPQPGCYPIELTIQPDPTDSSTINGSGSVHIMPKSRPSIEAISVTNGAPPPPFPNSIYQTVTAGESPLSWGFYVWGAHNAPFIGVDLEQRNMNHYAMVDVDGSTVGHVRIEAPAGAGEYSIEANASIAANGAVLGIPTGLLTAQFHPDPDATGDYTIRWRINNGNEQSMFLTVDPA